MNEKLLFTILITHTKYLTMFIDKITQNELYYKDDSKNVCVINILEEISGFLPRETLDMRGL
jgi:hypothetical protein